MARRGWGEGSICRRVAHRNGRDYVYWRAVLPGGPSGRRREFQARSEKVVRAWLRQNIATVSRGLPVTGRTSVTVGAYAVDWLRDTSLTVRPTTTEFYRHALRHIEPLAALPIAALSPQHVRDLIATRVDAGLASRTIRGIVQTLALVLKRAEEDGLVERNVAALVRLPRLEQRVPRHFTKEQAHRIVEFGRGDPLGSLYVVALGTALRRGELLALTWTDVDLKQATLRVDRSKTKAGMRRIPLSQVVLDTLRALPRSPGPIWAYHPASVSHDFGDFCRRAGVPVLTLHELRHTALTLMAEENVPIEVRRWIAGHSKTEETSRYSHESEALMRDAVERLGRAVG